MKSSVRQDRQYVPDLEVQKDQRSNQQCWSWEQLIEEGVEELHDVIDICWHEVHNLSKLCLLTRPATYMQANMCTKDLYRQWICWLSLKRESKRVVMHACNQVNIHAGSKHTCTDMQRASIGFHWQPVALWVCVQQMIRLDYKDNHWARKLSLFARTCYSTLYSKWQNDSSSITLNWEPKLFCTQQLWALLASWFARWWTAVSCAHMLLPQAWGTQTSELPTGSWYSHSRPAKKPHVFVIHCCRVDIKDLHTKCIQNAGITRLVMLAQW